jgi:hypothetical protein
VHKTVTELTTYEHVSAWRRNVHCAIISLSDVTGAYQISLNTLSCHVIWGRQQDSKLIYFSSFWFRKTKMISICVIYSLSNSSTKWITNKTIVNSGSWYSDGQEIPSCCRNRHQRRPPINSNLSHFKSFHIITKYLTKTRFPFKGRSWSRCTASDLYSGVTRFESRPGDSSSSSLLLINSAIVPRLGHDRFLQNPFQLTVQESSYHSTLYDHFGSVGTGAVQSV